METGFTGGLDLTEEQYIAYAETRFEAIAPLMDASDWSQFIDDEGCKVYSRKNDAGFVDLKRELELNKSADEAAKYLVNRFNQLLHNKHMTLEKTKTFSANSEIVYQVVSPPVPFVSD